MRATVMYSAGDVRVENIPDARVIKPTDALVSRACICGSDLWPYKSTEPSETGIVMGHEALEGLAVEWMEKVTVEQYEG